MQVNIHEAKSQLSRLIQRSLEGEEVIIARNNQPVIRLLPIKPTPEKRKLGSLQGIIKSIDSDFNTPMDDFKEYM